MPVNRKYNIQELLSACKYYEEETGKRISFEYAPIKGLNDSRKLRRRYRCSMSDNLEKRILIKYNKYIII